MKKQIIKSYYMIFWFETIIMILLVLNSFNSSVSSVYLLPFILFISDLIFLFLLGYEKYNKRLSKLMMFEMIMYSIIFLLLYYLFGVFIGFAKNGNYLTLYGFTIFIIPLILKIIFKEYLRYSLLKKCGNNIFLIIYTTILFIMVDVLSSINIVNYNNPYDIFLFLSITLLSSISINILATYVSKKVGYKPIIVYLLITSLYQYILPIVPNPNEYLKSIINLIVPILILLKIMKTVNKYSDIVYEIDRNYNKSKLVTLIFPILLTIIIIYLISGYFKYYALAIASGSMSPVFDRGDIVILEQVNEKYNNYDKLSEGQIIAYKIDKDIVVHRIIRKIENDNELFFYTKGDANKEEDNCVINKENIIGIVRFKVPYVGYPTIWFSEM